MYLDQDLADRAIHSITGHKSIKPDLSLPADEKELYARQMEVFAAHMEWVDYQIARVVKELARSGELDDTLIFVTSDKGASGEGGLAGTFNETYVLNELQNQRWIERIAAG